MKGKRAVVLGAGAVGICCALALRDRGMEVKLVDRKGAAEETSSGNAGVVATNAILPLLTPGMLSSLPAFALQASPKLRYSPLYVLRHARRFARLTLGATGSHAARVADALAPLVQDSARRCRPLAERAGCGGLLSPDGWFHLYRGESELRGAGESFEMLRERGVDLEPIGKDALHDLEPEVRPIFSGGVWYRCSITCSDPGAMLKGFASLLEREGGELARGEAVGFSEGDGRCEVRYAGGEAEQCDLLVVALGAWSAEFLRPEADFPLIVERGYNAHCPPLGGASLRRPFLDVERGYVLHQMAAGMRITTGTELNFIDAPPSRGQLDLALRSAAEAFPIDRGGEGPMWLGYRPTLPDSMPAIGFLREGSKVLLAFGHHHIGLTCAPGTGEAVACLAAGESPPFDVAPFAPGRFGRRAC